MADQQQPFWRTKSLEEMNATEWESLCDGCGKCCLNKLEDWDTGEIFHTSVACKLFDDATCLCRDYANRFAHVPDCIKLSAEDVSQYKWLPTTCAYRLVSEGRDLPRWHHLVSGDASTVHEAGISAQNRTVSEVGLTAEDWEKHIVEWAK